MPSNVLVVVVDGLRASALGAYGNTSFATPALDHFAANSLLLDWCYAPSEDLPDIYRALWHSPTAASLPRLFAESNYATTLVTDEPALNSCTGASDFDEYIQLVASPQAGESPARASNSSDTAIARIFAAALNEVGKTIRDKPLLLWMHARGMYGPWDAPLEFQQSLLDDDDLPPIESLAPPDFVVSADDDPDAAFRYASAYAAQAIVLDACWESFFDTLLAADAGEWLIMLIGAHGFPLAEHARIGGVDPRLHVEQLHVPWLIQFPNNLGRLARTGTLTSHIDLLPTLIDWIDRDRKLDHNSLGGISVLPLATSARAASRDTIISKSATARAIRTPDWCLREDVSTNSDLHAVNAASSAPELYVRPDDRWEANDVAKLCPEVVDELRAR